MTRRGSITVFLTLILVLIVGVIGACLEYSRAQAVSCQVQLAACSAAESIAAGYHAPLYAQYQILGRLIPGGDTGGWEEETLRYVEAYDGTKGEQGDRGNLITFLGKEASWTNVAWLTDQNGDVFTHLAAEAMKYSGVSVVLGDWKERLGLQDSEAENAMRENAGKSEVNASDVLSGYDSWAESVANAGQQAENSAEQQDQAAEEAAEENTGESGQPSTAADRGEHGSAMAELREEKQKGQKFLDMVEDMKQVMQNGVLSVVLPEGKSLPTGSISDGNLPSNLSAAARSRCAEGSTVSGGSTLLVDEYLMRNLNCYTTEPARQITCELEYVIAGEKTDSANLESVVNRLVLMRTALNLAYLNTSALRQAEASEAATLAVGWTGQVELIPVTEKILLAAWAFAESLVDVRTLLSGEKEELRKTDSNWNLQLANLGSALEQSTTAQSSGNQGVSYEDYLRICLYLDNSTEMVYRAMDVIQWNVAAIDPDFRMDDCVVCGDLTVTAETGSMFSGLYGKIGQMSELRYQKSSSFTYLGD